MTRSQRKLKLAALTVTVCMAAFAAPSFNPQPDPPGVVAKSADSRSVAFNPQPDPPGVVAKSADSRSFNPQPDPPGLV